ncbi:YdhK family protein [Corynebacterium sp. LK2510]|uniref:YdhK family protein n=1 Tax=Corynebacterium sp. LK2510 TaxID=3110472 RepID=UPI0034CD92A8
MNRTLTAAVAASALALAACSPAGETASTQVSSSAETSTATSTQTSSSAAAEAGHVHDHGDHPSDGGPAPAGMVEATNPTYPVGTEVTLTGDHMPGMEGADATIVGAYSTNTFAVSYDPTDGSPRVTNHKWVVQEEVVGDGELSEGSVVTLNADHMPGMAGATATIDSVTDQTVYMVDFATDGMTMKNHKWVVEDEIAPRA